MIIPTKISRKTYNKQKLKTNAAAFKHRHELFRVNQVDDSEITAVGAELVLMTQEEEHPWFLIPTDIMEHYSLLTWGLWAGEHPGDPSKAPPTYASQSYHPLTVLRMAYDEWVYGRNASNTFLDIQKCIDIATEEYTHVR